MNMQSINGLNSGERRRAVRGRRRRGLAVVEAAVTLPVIVTMMLGLWEVGRLVQVNQLLTNAVREGARLAAGGTTNNTPVTVTMVQNEVKNYLTSAGLPTAAISGSTVTITNLSANSWTDPSDALPLDHFRVTMTIPSGAAYNALRLGLTTTITGATSMTVSADWMSANDSQVSVNAQLPF